MKNIYQVLQQKEAGVERLRKELQALRVVAPLLEEKQEEDPEVVNGSVPGSDLSHAVSPGSETVGATGGPQRPSTHRVWSWGSPEKEPWQCRMRHRQCFSLAVFYEASERSGIRAGKSVPIAGTGDRTP